MKYLLKSLYERYLQLYRFDKEIEIQCTDTFPLLFRHGLCEKVASGLEEYCADYWLKQLQESMARCTGRRNITEILLKRR